jgi:hypothetical protein
LTQKGVVLKFCQVLLLMTLVLTADRMVGAQALTPGPVLVASESMTQSGLFLPELLAPGHDALLQGLGLTPSIREARPAEPLKPAVPNPRLSVQDRFTLFWNDTYASPGAFAGLSMGALVDQVSHTPAKWDGDGSAYTRRFASEYGQLATRNVIHEGLDGLTGLDPRYPVCRCSGKLRRGAHAMEMTFVTYRQDGRLTLDMPQIAGAYGSGIVSTYWYPHRLYSPLVQGVQFGHEQMGEIMVGNLVKEFAPDLHRALHLHAIAARAHPRPMDDD